VLRRLPTADAFRVLQPVMKPHLRSVRLAGLLAVGEALTALMSPWALKIALDHGIEARPLPPVLSPLEGLDPSQLILVAGLVSVVVVGLNAVLGYQVVLRSETTAERIGRDARGLLFDHLARAPLAFHDRQRSGELASRLITDVNRLLDAVIAWYTRLAPELLMLIGMTVVLVGIDPLLAAIALFGAAPMWVVSARRRRQVRAAEQAAREANGALATTVADFMRNIRALKAFGRDGFVDRTFHRRSNTATDRNIRSYRVQAQWSPVTDLVLALGSAAVLVAAAHRALDRQLSVGTMLVVLSYVSMLYGPVRSLSGLGATMAKAGVSAGRVGELLAEGGGTDLDGHLPFTSRRGVTLSLEHVWFGYDPQQPVLRDFSLRVKPGETVALIGPSGAGKSTVCSLVLRLYRPDTGRVALDGADIADLLEHDLRQVIGYVPQGAWMLDGTVAENIALGRTDLSAERIRQAGHDCLVDPFVLPLPDGYDTEVGENGVRMSGGERQRIALARAIAADAPVLLLDEPTTGLDGDARTHVIEAIQRAAGDRAVLIVTHDLDLALRADRIVDLGAQRNRSPRWPAPAAPARPTEEVNHHGPFPFP
jgi:ABC-type multidrug transport system fused ATPase/permease subunit